MDSDQKFLKEVKEYILSIHENVVSKTGEPKELRQGHELYFIVFRALNKSKSNLDFVSYLIKLIAEEHPFIEGNKRTAYVVGKTLLLFLGNKLLCLNERTAEKFIRIIAIRCEKERPKDVKEIKKFVNMNSKYVPMKIFDNKNSWNNFFKKQHPKIRSETIQKYLKKLNMEINENGK
jgi:prophage maintenance system killer protein